MSYLDKVKRRNADSTCFVTSNEPMGTKHNNMLKLLSNIKRPYIPTETTKPAGWLGVLLSKLCTTKNKNAKRKTKSSRSRKTSGLDWNYSKLSAEDRLYLKSQIAIWFPWIVHRPTLSELETALAEIGAKILRNMTDFQIMDLNPSLSERKMQRKLFRECHHKLSSRNVDILMKSNSSVSRRSKAWYEAKDSPEKKLTNLSFISSKLEPARTQVPANSFIRAEKNWRHNLMGGQKVTSSPEITKTVETLNETDRSRLLSLYDSCTYNVPSWFYWLIETGAKILLEIASVDEDDVLVAEAKDLVNRPRQISIHFIPLGDSSKVNGNLFVSLREQEMRSLNPKTQVDRSLSPKTRMNRSRNNKMPTREVNENTHCFLSPRLGETLSLATVNTGNTAEHFPLVSCSSMEQSDGSITQDKFFQEERVLSFKHKWARTLPTNTKLKKSKLPESRGRMKEKHALKCEKHFKSIKNKFDSDVTKYQKDIILSQTKPPLSDNGEKKMARGIQVFYKKIKKFLRIDNDSKQNGDKGDSETSSGATDYDFKREAGQNYKSNLFIKSKHKRKYESTTKSLITSVSDPYIRSFSQEGIISREHHTKNSCKLSLTNNSNKCSNKNVEVVTATSEGRMRHKQKQKMDNKQKIHRRRKEVCHKRGRRNRTVRFVEQDHIKPMDKSNSSLNDTGTNLHCDFLVDNLASLQSFEVCYLMKNKSQNRRTDDESSNEECNFKKEKSILPDSKLCMIKAFLAQKFKADHRQEVTTRKGSMEATDYGEPKIGQNQYLDKCQRSVQSQVCNDTMRHLQDDTNSGLDVASRYGDVLEVNGHDETLLHDFIKEQWRAGYKEQNYAPSDGNSSYAASHICAESSLRLSFSKDLSIKSSKDLSSNQEHGMTNNTCRFMPSTDEHSTMSATECRQGLNTDLSDSSSCENRQRDYSNKQDAATFHQEVIKNLCRTAIPRKKKLPESQDLQYFGCDSYERTFSENITSRSVFSKVTTEASKSHENRSSTSFKDSWLSLKDLSSLLTYCSKILSSNEPLTENTVELLKAVNATLSWYSVKDDNIFPQTQAPESNKDPQNKLNKELPSCTCKRHVLRNVNSGKHSSHFDKVKLAYRQKCNDIRSKLSRVNEKSFCQKPLKVSHHQLNETQNKLDSDKEEQIDVSKEMRQKPLPDSESQNSWKDLWQRPRQSVQLEDHVEMSRHTMPYVTDFLLDKPTYYDSYTKQMSTKNQSKSIDRKSSPDEQPVFTVEKKQYKEHEDSILVPREGNNTMTYEPMFTSQSVFKDEQPGHYQDQVNKVKAMRVPKCSLPKEADQKKLQDLHCAVRNKTASCLTNPSNSYGPTYSPLKNVDAKQYYNAPRREPSNSYFYRRKQKKPFFNVSCGSRKGFTDLPDKLEPPFFYWASKVPLDVRRNRFVGPESALPMFYGQDNAGVMESLIKRYGVYSEAADIAANSDNYTAENMSSPVFTHYPQLVPHIYSHPPAHVQWPGAAENMMSPMLNQYPQSVINSPKLHLFSPHPDQRPVVQTMGNTMQTQYLQQAPNTSKPQLYSHQLDQRPIVAENMSNPVLPHYQQLLPCTSMPQAYSQQTYPRPVSKKETIKKETVEYIASILKDYIPRKQSISSLQPQTPGDDKKTNEFNLTEDEKKLIESLRGKLDTRLLKCLLKAEQSPQVTPTPSPKAQSTEHLSSKCTCCKTKVCSSYLCKGIKQKQGECWFNPISSDARYDYAIKRMYSKGLQADMSCAGGKNHGLALHSQGHCSTNITCQSSAAHCCKNYFSDENVSDEKCPETIKQFFGPKRESKNFLRVPQNTSNRNKSVQTSFIFPVKNSSEQHSPFSSPQDISSELHLRRKNGSSPKQKFSRERKRAIQKFRQGKNKCAIDKNDVAEETSTSCRRSTGTTRKLESESNTITSDYHPRPCTTDKSCDCDFYCKSLQRKEVEHQPLQNQTRTDECPRPAWPEHANKPCTDTAVQERTCPKDCPDQNRPFVHIRYKSKKVNGKSEITVDSVPCDKERVTSPVKNLALQLKKYVQKIIEESRELKQQALSIDKRHFTDCTDGGVKRDAITVRTDNEQEEGGQTSKGWCYQLKIKPPESPPIRKVSEESLVGQNVNFGNNICEEQTSQRGYDILIDLTLPDDSSLSRDLLSRILKFAVRTLLRPERHEDDESIKSSSLLCCGDDVTGNVNGNNCMDYQDTDICTCNKTVPGSRTEGTKHYSQSFTRKGSQKLCLVKKCERKVQSELQVLPTINHRTAAIAGQIGRHCRNNRAKRFRSHVQPYGDSVKIWSCPLDSAPVLHNHKVWKSTQIENAHGHQSPTYAKSKHKHKWLHSSKDCDVQKMISEELHAPVVENGQFFITQCTVNEGIDHLAPSNIGLDYCSQCKKLHFSISRKASGSNVFSKGGRQLTRDIILDKNLKLPEQKRLMETKQVNGKPPSSARDWKNKIKGNEGLTSRASVNCLDSDLIMKNFTGSSEIVVRDSQLIADISACNRSVAETSDSKHETDRNKTESIFHRSRCWPLINQKATASLKSYFEEEQINLISKSNDSAPDDSAASSQRIKDLPLDSVTAYMRHSKDKNDQLNVGDRSYFLGFVACKNTSTMTENIEAQETSVKVRDEKTNRAITQFNRIDDISAHGTLQDNRKKTLTKQANEAKSVKDSKKKRVKIKCDAKRAVNEDQWQNIFISSAELTEANSHRVVLEGAFYKSKNPGECPPAHGEQLSSFLPQNSTCLLPYRLVLFASRQDANGQTISGTYLRKMVSLDRFFKWKVSIQIPGGGE